MSITTKRRRTALRPVLPVDELFERISDSDPSACREILHEYAWQELETGQSKKGVYAMALSSVDGDRDRAEARYIRLRVDQLEEEFTVWEEEQEDARNEEDQRHEASADFLRTMAAVGFFILALIAIVSWT